MSIQDLARDLSRLHRPSPWRIFAYFRWKRKQQLRHAVAAIHESLRGDWKPIMKLVEQAADFRSGESSS